MKIIKIIKIAIKIAKIVKHIREKTLCKEEFSSKNKELKQLLSQLKGE